MATNSEYRGPILGTFEGKPFRYQGDRHLLTVAPNGSGKDVSCINPLMIRHRGSLIVCDVKGDTATNFARWRAEVLKQKVYVVDPFGVVPDWAIPQRPPVPRTDADGVVHLEMPPLRARCNPLDSVRSSNIPVAIAKQLSAALVIPDPGKPHWGQGGRSLLGAVNVFAALEPEYDMPRTLGSVWDDLNASNEPNYADDGGRLPSNFDILLMMMAKSLVGGGYPAREASRFLGGAHDEVRSLRQTIFTNCGAILDDPQIIESLSASDIDFDMIQKEPTSIFLCLPGSLSDSHGRWFRLILSCILAALERGPLRPTSSTAPRTMIVCNEFATQGKNDLIVEAFPRLRAYGVQFWIFVQDLAQLEYHYGKAYTTFIGNSGVVQNFGGTPDYFTAEKLSKMGGDKTILVESWTDRQGLTGSSTSTSVAARPIVFPHEIMTMNGEPGTDLRQLLLMTGQGPVWADRVRYYTDFPDFTAWAQQRGLAV